MYKTFQDIQNNQRVTQSISDILAQGTTEVWYRKNVGSITLTTRELTNSFNLFNLEITHVKLAEVASKNKEALFFALQGRNWSPAGEAKDLLKSHGLTHTSMSCGDILIIEDTPYVCVTQGWKKIGQDGKIL